MSGGYEGRFWLTWTNTPRRLLADEDGAVAETCRLGACASLTYDPLSDSGRTPPDGE